MRPIEEFKLSPGQVMELLQEEGWALERSRDDRVPVRQIRYGPSWVDITLTDGEVVELPTLEVYQTVVGRLSFRQWGFSRQQRPRSQGGGETTSRCLRRVGRLFNPRLYDEALAEDAREDEFRRQQRLGRCSLCGRG